MKESIIKAGLDSGMLNYVDNGTPRQYFISHWADEECLEQLADLLIQECCAIIKEWKKEPFPFDEDLAVSLLREHFGVEE